MFGDKFYKRLDDLEPWQQTVFALALAERMYPNYQLYVESTDRGDARVFRHALDILWRYLTERSSRLDLGGELEAFEQYIPDPAKEECYGAYPALDACVALGCAYNSVICRTGDESTDASHASIGSVAGFLELQAGEALEEEALYEASLMEEEMTFQVELLNRVSHPRDAQAILAIRDFAAQGGVSNLGISLAE